MKLNKNHFYKIVNFFSGKEKSDSNNLADQPTDQQIKELIQNVLSIKDSIVKEIMIPRVNISFINEDNSLKERLIGTVMTLIILKLFLENGPST